MRRRMELGLSIDDVMARTKLGRRTLEMLEQGDLQELPHPVYIKGFIKAYIAVLNVEMEDLLPGLDGVLDSSAPAEAPPRVKPVRSLQNVQPYSVPLPSAKRVKSIILVLLLLLLALGGLIWYSLEEEPALDSGSLLPREENSTQALGASNVTSPMPAAKLEEDQPEVAESAEEALQAQNAQGSAAAGLQESNTSDAPQASAAPGAPLANNSTAAGVNATPGTATGTNASSPLAAVNATNALGDLGSEKPSVELKSPAGTGKTLIVRAKDQCWVGLTLDLETAKDFYLYPNQYAVIRFHETVTLRLGNAGGVSFVYNGKEFPTSFEKGVVKTLTFPPGN
ncbi:RodZ domain-containing protein [Megalodesulfovibrio paquesii]